MKNIIFIMIIIPFMMHGQNCNHEGYYLYQSVYPNDDDAFWFPNNTEVQGVTNDGENWFITTTGHTDGSGTLHWGKLWRIPKSVPLGASSTSNPNVAAIEMYDIPELNDSNNPYWHWGDPDHYEYNGVDYILVPIWPISGNGIIACFKADPLEFISYTNIPLRPGWCAIDYNGFLYSSLNHISSLKRFEVDWNILTSNNNENALSSPETVNLNFDGNDYNELKHMQGGEFSESGELLYLISGSAGCLWTGEDQFPSDGIHVFRTSDWEEIEKSTKYGEHYFKYYFDNDCQGFGGSESPEGLTIWDLDDGSVDQHGGGLHVLTFHWNLAIIGSNDHKVSMHHFSNKVFLDSEANTSILGPYSGNELYPFQNLNDANSFYPIWDGAEMIFKAGEYNGLENIGIIDKKIKITSKGGPAIVGQQ